jgi:D-alanyl-D-alanine carboxypeptidase/D-alanyl-D-alanine-endopeptidase (penicillin-binding protein 4)
MIRARVALTMIVASTLAISVSASTRAAPPQLSQVLGKALAARDIDPRRTAALAVDLETGQVVFATNTDRSLLPASAEKLPVAFAALHVLGPEYRFRTDVVGRGVRSGRVWDGNLVLVGLGDPTLGLDDLSGLARQVARLGIRRVEGRLLGDESHFDARRDGPGWKPSFVGIESRPLSALSVRGIALRTADGSASATVKAFAVALARQGIVVTGRRRAALEDTDATVLARDVSEPMRTIVRHMNRDSDNFVAEMVLKELGSTVTRRGSTAAGAFVVREALAAAEIPLDGVRIADGSGLSALDRLTARALVAILHTGATDPSIRDAFVTSLAVAGISGTMKNRLVRRPTKSRVIAKTGTTLRASALAGFIRRRYVFAVIQNGSPVPYWSARAAQDRFVTVLARAG